MTHVATVNVIQCYLGEEPTWHAFLKGRYLAVVEHLHAAKVILHSCAVHARVLLPTQAPGWLAAITGLSPAEPNGSRYSGQSSSQVTGLQGVRHKPQLTPCGHFTWATRGVQGLLTTSCQWFAEHCSAGSLVLKLLSARLIPAVSAAPNSTGFFTCKSFRCCSFNLESLRRLLPSLLPLLPAHTASTSCHFQAYDQAGPALIPAHQKLKPSLFCAGPPMAAEGNSYGGMSPSC